MNKIEKELIQIFAEFGLNVSVGKAYVSLLKNNPATGYEISAHSGIPRSAIYSVLKNMESQGLINTVAQSPKKYIPLSPNSLIEHLNQLHNHRVESLTETFGELELSDEPFDFWHLHGYQNIVLKMKECVNNSNEKLFMSGWDKEFLQLSNELENAEKRGVKITLFSFSEISVNVGEVVTYNLVEKDLMSIWKPKILLVSDHEETIMGSTIEDHTARAIWTQNKAITEIATDHIILDITLAGTRLNFDSTPLVQRVMRRPEIHLNELLT
jgi:sugar-specific transcriptional regulator TrmB